MLALIQTMKKIFEKLFRTQKRKTEEKDFEWEKFQEVAKEQFLKLSKKGLSIPVMTLQHKERNRGVLK